MQPKRVLLLVPPPTAKGGISNYYSVLKPLFNIRVDYLYRGNRNQPFEENPMTRLLRNVFDFLRFIKELLSGGVSLVHINTSLSLSSAIRDGFYLLVAKMLGIKYIVFFRGWDLNEADKIERKHLPWFRILYLGANALITLTTASKQSLQKWGYSKDIYLETTVVDESLLRYASEDTASSRDQSEAFTVLFLARLQRAKGIYELIEAIRILRSKHPSIRLIVAGSGSEEDRIKKEYDYDWIELIGHVTERKKALAYQTADVYVLPSYTEGMPNSVLEAMAFGLPVICSKVGALPEIIKNQINGILLDCIEPQSLAMAIESLLLDKELVKHMSSNNRIEAKRFYSLNVVSRLETIYKTVLEGK